MPRDQSAGMSTTTAPAASLPLHDRLQSGRRRHRGVLAVTAVVVGLTLPVTGAGSAIAAPHPPSLASALAATSALTGPVAMGKLDV
jgi:hypothetical protein